MNSNLIYNLRSDLRALKQKYTTLLERNKELIEINKELINKVNLLEIDKFTAAKVPL